MKIWNVKWVESGGQKRTFFLSVPLPPFLTWKSKRSLVSRSHPIPLPFFRSLRNIIIPLDKSPWRPPRPSLPLPKATHRTSAAPREISPFLSDKLWTMNKELWTMNDSTWPYRPFFSSCTNIFTIKMQPFVWMWITGVGCFYETSGFMGHAASRSGEAVKMMWFSTLFSNHGHSHCQ